MTTCDRTVCPRDCEGRSRTMNRKKRPEFFFYSHRANGYRFDRMRRLRFLVFLFTLASWTLSAQTDPAPGLRNAVVLIIRHAEKPPEGYELTPAGFKRASAYPGYFQHFQFDSQPVKPDALFAAADSKSSHRPRLTLEPLSQASGVHLDAGFKAKQPGALAEALKTSPHGTNILICWHHGQIPELIRDLGGDPGKFLPNGKWPDDVFQWIVVLRYDGEGRLIPGKSRCVNENLMPEDASHNPPQ